MGPHESQPVLQAGAALGKAPVAVIMVHGRNASAENILDLVPAIGRPDLTYLAPAAAQHTWYPNSFMAPRESNEPGLSSALEVLRGLVARIEAAGISREKIVVLGFSQGACLSTEFAIRNASRFGGFVIFSGGAIGPPGTVWDDSGRFDGTPMFFGCSDRDAHVPESRVIESSDLCARMDAAVTRRIYPGMGHTINEDEIAWARNLLDALAG